MRHTSFLVSIPARPQARRHARQARHDQQTPRQFSSAGRVTFLDIGPKFLQPDGTITREVMGDYLHPSSKGYEIWAEAIEPLLVKLLAETN